MNIHCKIVEVWPEDHLIVARYWTDVITEEMLASDSNRKENGTPVRCRTDVSITLPVPTPSIEEIDAIIKRNVPLEWLKMLEAKKDPNINTEVDHINNLVNVEKTFTETEIVPVLPLAQSDELSEEDINKLLNTIKT